MKKLMLIVVIFALAGDAWAGPYFHFIGQAGYQRQVLSEFCFNPNAVVNSGSSCTSVPLVTHSFRDGYILIPNEDWAPVTLGGAFGPGQRPMLTIGPAANLSPALKGVLLSGLSALTPDASFANLKSLLAPPPPGSSPDVTLNLGVKWTAQFTNSHKVVGGYVLSIGPALAF